MHSSTIASLFVAPLLVAAQTAAGPGSPGLMATFLEYSSPLCAQASETGSNGVYGLANTCYPIEGSAPVAAEVGTIPALQSYKECQVAFYTGSDCSGEPVAGVIDRCSAAFDGSTLQSVFVACS